VKSKVDTLIRLHPDYPSWIAGYRPAGGRKVGACAMIPKRCGTVSAANIGRHIGVPRGEEQNARMNSANTAIDFEKMRLESVTELNRSLALLAATSLMSRHLYPADKTTKAFDHLLSGSRLIAEEAAGKLDSLGHAHKDGPAPVPG
jgi:hypothetical protein